MLHSIFISYFMAKNAFHRNFFSKISFLFFSQKHCPFFAFFALYIRVYSSYLFLFIFLFSVFRLCAPCQTSPQSIVCLCQMYGDDSSSQANSMLLTTLLAEALAKSSNQQQTSQAPTTTTTSQLEQFLQANGKLLE